MYQKELDVSSAPLNKTFITSNHCVINRLIIQLSWDQDCKSKYFMESVSDVSTVESLLTEIKKRLNSFR